MQPAISPCASKLAHDPDSLAPYFVEEIRRYLESKYGSDQVHEGGLRVYTSLDMDLQRAANRAVLDGLAAYERRHGWQRTPAECLVGRGNARQLPASGLGQRTRSQRLCPRPGHGGDAGIRDYQIWPLLRNA